MEVPDLEILTEAKDLSDAIAMTRDAIGLKCISMEDAGEEIPSPSATLDASKGIFYNEGETVVSFVYIMHT